MQKISLSGEVRSISSDSLSEDHGFKSHLSYSLTSRNEVKNTKETKNIQRIKKGIKNMAASKLKKTRTITDKITVKGHLSADGTVIEYTDENDLVQRVEVAELLSVFKDNDIDFSVSLKTEEDLPEVDEEVEEDE